MINKKKKNAEITTQQIVMFIVLILSFAVILYFIITINFGKNTDETVCHNSVITRSSIPLAKEVEAVPINCKTSYVCLSKDGSCEKMTSPEIIKVKTKEEVYSALAEQGANCWWMFGEGKADYIGNKFTSDLYCSICSQIAFDDSLENLFAIDLSDTAGIPKEFSSSLINKKDFYEYLAKTNVSGKDVTYLDYLLGLQNSKLISDALESKDYTFGYIDVRKQHFILMGEFSKVGVLQEIVTGAVKGALLFLVLPIPYVGGYLGMVVVASTVYNPFVKKGYLVGTTVAGESGHNYLSPAIIEANSEDFSKLQCADIKTLA